MGDARVIRWISTPDEARSRSQQVGGVYTCWACGECAHDAVVKTRPLPSDGDLFGMYHLDCQPRVSTSKDGK